MHQRRRRPAAPAILAVAVLAMSLASDAIRPLPLEPASITFVRSAGRTADLFEVDVRAGTARRIDTGPGTASSPAWSPTGDRLAYARRNPQLGEGYAIEVLDARSGHRVRLTSGEAIDGSPTWSPDGASLGYSGNAVGPGFGVHVIDVGSGASRWLTAGQAPSWSPDGRMIAFVRLELGRFRVDAVRPDGSGLRPITGSDVHEERDPAWSPDGRFIATASRASRDSGTWDIAILDVESGARRTFERPESDERYPAWSPNGSYLAFARIRADAADIWLLDLRTGIESRLTSGPLFDLMPSWRPDGLE
jgi:TolB protein